MFWPRVEGSAPSGGPSLLRAQPITSIGETGTRPRPEARSRDSALPQGVSLVWKVKRRNGNLRVSGSLGCSRLAGCYMISPEQTPERVLQQKGSPGLTFIPSLLPSPEEEVRGDRGAPGRATSPSHPSQRPALCGPPPPLPRTAGRHRPLARGVSRRARAPPDCCGAVRSRLPRGPGDPADTWWRARREPLQRPALAPSSVWSQARRGPAGGGGSGGGILLLPRPAPPPPSSQAFSSASARPSRAPLHGPGALAPGGSLSTVPFPEQRKRERE